MKAHSIVMVFALTMTVIGNDASSQAEGIWNIVPSPNAPPEPLGNTLLDVAAISATDVWAIGFHHNPTYCTFCPAPLAMHWDGAQWSLVETPTIAQPKVQFNSVSAVSSDDVWAVGHWINDTALSAGTLIEHWNGTSWSVVSSPNPGMFNALYGVAAASSDNIWAVGDKWLSWSQKVPLILHYDGKEWSEVEYPPVAYGELASVFALAEDDVWAVGVAGVLSTGFETLTLHWNGTSWTQVPFPTEPGALYVALYSVSGAASDDVWAVGVHKYLNGNGHQISLARTYHWDGSSWTSVLPGVFGTDSRMYDVHAVASDDVWAVGGEPCPQFNPPCSDPNMAFRYVTVHWDGVSWRNVPNPNQGVLYAVSASPSSDAWAVGFGMDDLAYSTGTYTLHYTLPCPADLTDAAGGVPDGDINVFDLFVLLDNWGTNGAGADLAPANNVVDVFDLFVLLDSWGKCN